MGKRLTRSGESLSATNSERIVLYCAGPSPCVRRVWITLREKGLDFDTVEVDLANMQQRSQGYLALNPNGFVPTLVHNTEVIFESGVINEYLEDQFPEVPLLPRDPYERAQARMWMNAEGAMAKVFRPVMYQHLMGPIHHISRTHEEALAIAGKASEDPQDLAWESRVWRMQVLTGAEEARARTTLFAWLDNVEEALADREYLVGDAFSQADISMYPRIRMFDYLGSPLASARYPNVLRWMSTLEKRGSFADSLTGEARKLNRVATSPVVVSALRPLKSPSSERTLLERAKLWLLGKAMRRALGVDALLQSGAAASPLWLPDAPPAVQAARPLRLLAFRGSEVALYGDPLAPETQRLQLLLTAAALPFELMPVSPTELDALPAAFFERNPQRQLPIVVQDGRVLCGTDVIADYILGQAGEDRLWQPTTSLEAAKLRMWLALEAGNHKEFYPLWQRHVAGHDAVTYIADEPKTLQRIQFVLRILDAALSESAFLCSGKPSYADLAWYSRITALRKVPGFSLSGLGHVARWYDAMMPAQPMAAQQ